MERTRNGSCRAFSSTSRRMAMHVGTAEGARAVVVVPYRWCKLMKTLWIYMSARAVKPVMHKSLSLAEAMVTINVLLSDTKQRKSSERVGPTI